MAYLSLLFINKHLAFFFSYWKFGASFHQVRIWKEGSGSEPDSYWAGANKVDSFYVGTEKCYYIYLVICVCIRAHMNVHMPLHAPCTRDERSEDSLEWLIFFLLSYGSWNGTQLVYHGGRHLYPMSHFTISYDREFCLENFSVLKQERCKFSQVMFKYQE